MAPVVDFDWGIPRRNYGPLSPLGLLWRQGLGVFAALGEVLAEFLGLLEQTLRHFNVLRTRYSRDFINDLVA